MTCIWFWTEHIISSNGTLRRARWHVLSASPNPRIVVYTFWHKHTKIVQRLLHYCILLIFQLEATASLTFFFQPLYTSHFHPFVDDAPHCVARILIESGLYRAHGFCHFPHCERSCTMQSEDDLYDAAPFLCMGPPMK